MSDNIIEFENVSFDYGENGENAVLDNFSVKIKRGDFVAILGHNGSGKSTVARLMNGLRVPKSGKVSVDGLDTAKEESRFEVRKRVGLVFQNPDNQIVATVVEDDVAFGPENLGVDSKEIRERVDNALKQVDMYDFKDKAPHLLSGGQKQRVAIAGILAMQPICIVLDEPTAMLDPSGRREVMAALKKLNKENNITVVLITHYMEEAAAASRIIVMDNGKITADDTPYNIFKQADMLKKAGLSVPQTVELNDELKKIGIDLCGSFLTEDEIATALTEFLTEE